MFNRIAHVCLNVKNLQRSLDFYARMGSHPIAKPVTCRLFPTCDGLRF